MKNKDIKHNNPKKGVSTTKLIFRLNPTYIFLHALNMNQEKEPFPGWGSFTNKIWEEDPGLFYFLAGAPEYIFYLSAHKSRTQFARQADNKLKAIEKTPEYQQLIRETKTYLLFVQKQWEQKGGKALSLLREISGHSLSKQTMIVYLTHPKLKNGMALDKNIIAWGHPEDFKNYTIVYLCHELMHILTNLDKSDVAHAVIELMTDNEIRIKLNKKGKYFENQGHPNLRNLERKILPDWKDYLKKKDKDIFNFINQMKEKWG